MAITELFGMAGGKLALMLDGDGGYMRAFENLEFLAPVYQGDYVRVTARLLSVGRTSRRRSYEAHVAARPTASARNPPTARSWTRPSWRRVPSASPSRRASSSA